MKVTPSDKIDLRSNRLLTYQGAKSKGLCDTCWCYEKDQKRFCRSTELPIGFCPFPRRKKQIIKLHTGVNSIKVKPKVKPSYPQATFREYLDSPIGDNNHEKSSRR